MKKFIMLAFAVILTLSLCACGETNQAAGQNKTEADSPGKVQTESSTQDKAIVNHTTAAGGINVTETAEAAPRENSPAANEREAKEMRIKITVGKRELMAVLEDNATTRAIVKQMPMTLPMMDLYGQEMCYRYGAYALPTDNLQSDGYTVGDIAYWAPGGSLVILYRQNGEQFERQHLGHIDSGVEIFENTGDVKVTFALVKN